MFTTFVSENLRRIWDCGVSSFGAFCFCSQEVEEKIRGQSPRLFEDFVKPFQINLAEVVFLSVLPRYIDKPIVLCEDLVNEASVIFVINIMIIL